MQASNGRSAIMGSAILLVLLVPGLAVADPTGGAAPAAALVSGGPMSSLDLAAVHAFLDTPTAIRVAPDKAMPSVEVVSSFTGADGAPCRRVRETVSMDGQSVEAWGDICEVQGGDWSLAAPH